jgi:hypothetical protein
MQVLDVQLRMDGSGWTAPHVNRLSCCIVEKVNDEIDQTIIDASRRYHLGLGHTLI